MVKTTTKNCAAGVGSADLVAAVRFFAAVDFLAAMSEILSSHSNSFVLCIWSGNRNASGYSIFKDRIASAVGQTGRGALRVLRDSNEVLTVGCECAEVDSGRGRTRSTGGCTNLGCGCRDRGRYYAVVVERVLIDRVKDGCNVRGALRVAGIAQVFTWVDSDDYNTCQDGDNGNHQEDFEQGKTTLILDFLKCCFHINLGILNYLVTEMVLPCSGFLAVTVTRLLASFLTR